MAKSLHLDLGDLAPTELVMTPLAPQRPAADPGVMTELAPWSNCDLP